jgi:hypothetical protein
MSAADGSVAGRQKVVDNGPDSERYNIVILGDGYRREELAKFAGDVDNFVAVLKSTAPYDRIWGAINVHRVDVVSTESGADDPAHCGDGSAGQNLAPRTYFDSTFCGGGQIRRLLTCNDTLAHDTAKAQVPQVLMTMVIVNAGEYGGSGGRVATFSTNPAAAEIGLHEMGHTAFGFADEYETYQGCGTGEKGHDHYTGTEPVEPNVTATTDPARIKWRAVLTAAADGLPTTRNANCADCDTQPNPREDGYVGAYEGARYFHCGCYRPAFNCRMRVLGQPFCGVCQQVIAHALQPYLPEAPAAVALGAGATAQPPTG